MPNIKSSKKTVKTDKVKTVSNTSYTSRVKNGMKRLEKAVKENDKAKANDLLKSTLFSALISGRFTFFATVLYPVII